MEIKYYKNEICPVDGGILGEDIYTFNVLERIMRGVCAKTVTDGKNFIICHSCYPYPVWVWTSDAISDEGLKAAAQIIAEEFDISRTRFNVKYSFAKYLEGSAEVKILVNMKTYICKNAVRPKKAADGQAVRADMSRLDEVLSLTRAFHDETQADRKSDAEYLADIKASIESGSQFLWQDSRGEAVSVCHTRRSGGNVAISSVITRSDRRRRGYASSLVYSVAENLIAEGICPLLYTDADYEASNACYTSVGFVPVGSICTVVCGARG